MSAMASTLAAGAARAGPTARAGSRSNKTTTATASGMARVRAQRSVLAGQPVASSARAASAPRAGARALTVQVAAHDYDYDLVIIGAGVGGHGAALHAIECGMKVAIIEGGVMGGTCVNRGCVPSKALLAASGRVRDMKNASHLKMLGIEVDDVRFSRQGIADHAENLVTGIRNNLTNSMVSLGVDILKGQASLRDNHTVSYGNKKCTAQNIIIATGSTPFVPPGIEIDGKTVFTSDDALKLEWIPQWVAIIGSGYIGLEFSDVYTALGSDVTFIEAMPKIMPGFDAEIAKQAERILITPRNIDYRTDVLATKVIPGIPGEKPVTIELSDFKTREVVDTMEVDACLVATGRAPYTEGLNLESAIKVETQRGFVPVNEKMQVLDKDGGVVEGMWCIGDANGKMMLAHAASAQGIAAIECMQGREQVLNHNSVPAACFTHPEVSFVGLTEEQARAKADEEGFEVTVKKTSFKANSKALAEKEAEGMAKMIYRADTGEILGMWIMGLHAADLIHEASNAINQGIAADELKFAVHAHPTLAEVVDEVFKQVETIKR